MNVVRDSAIVRWLLCAFACLRTFFRDSVLGKFVRFCTDGTLIAQIRGSAVYKFIRYCTVGGALVAWTRNSAVYRFLFLDGLGARVLAAIARCAKRSAVCAFIWRDGRLENLWQKSVLSDVLSKLANLPGSILAGVRQKNASRWEGYTLLQMAGALGENSHVLVGLLLMVTLSIDHSKWNNMYAFVGVLAVCVLFVLAGTGRRDQRFDVKSLGPYVILNMAVICCSVLISQDVGGSLRFLVFQLTAFLVLLLVVSSVKNYQQLRLLVTLVVIGVTVAALYGCYQGVIGVEVKASQTDMTLELNQGMPGRIYSFFDNCNAFAGILVMAMPLTYALVLNAETRCGRAAAVVSLLLCALALAQTYSRAGWIGFAVTVVVFVLFWNWRLIPVLIIVGLCCLPILPQSIYNRILTIGHKGDGSANYRMAIYGATFRLLRKYAVQGAGLGSTVLHYTFKQFPAMYNGAYPVHTHSLYLQVWAETGIFGLLTFLAAMLHRGKTAIKAYVSATDRRVKLIIAAAVSGICGIMVMGLVEYVWFYTRSLYLFWFVFALVIAGAKVARSTEG